MTVILNDYVDAAVIFAVVLVNAIVGFVQETKSEKAIAALSAMLRTEATVKRGGVTVRIPAEEICPRP